MARVVGWIFPVMATSGRALLQASRNFKKPLRLFRFASYDSDFIFSQQPSTTILIVKYTYADLLIVISIFSKNR